MFKLPQIDIKKYHKAHISLTDAVIPYSFYNVNSTNDTLNYELNSISYQLQITHANYNITTFIAYLQSNLQAGFTITYNSATNKILFSHSTYDFSFLSSSTCFELIGFIEGNTYTSSANNLTSVIGINFFTIRNIQIVSSNFIMNNINTITPNQANIITSIPINSQMGGIINYNNINNISSLVHEITNINSLHIRLEDQDSDILNLNGLHWSANLLLTIE